MIALANLGSEVPEKEGEYLAFYQTVAADLSNGRKILRTRKAFLYFRDGKWQGDPPDYWREIPDWMQKEKAR